MSEKRQAKDLCINEQEIFVRNLKNLMVERNLNQYELAEKMGLKQPSVYVVLKGEHNPSFKFIATVCEVFNVTFRDLFNPSEEQFGEQLEKDEEILELKQELIRRNNQLEEVSKKLNETVKAEPTDDKVKVVMDGEETVVSIFGKEVEFTQITSVDIYKKTLEFVIKFDELSVK